MSNKHLTAAFGMDKKKLGLSKSATLVLLALADHADVDGVSYASQERLAIDGGLHQSTVGPAVHELVGRPEEFLQVTPGRQRATPTYRLNLGVMVSLRHPGRPRQSPAPPDPKPTSQGPAEPDPKPSEAPAQGPAAPGSRVRQNRNPGSGAAGTNPQRTPSEPKEREEALSLPGIGDQGKTGRTSETAAKRKTAAKGSKRRAPVPPEPDESRLGPPSPEALAVLDNAYAERRRKLALLNTSPGPTPITSPTKEAEAP
jgi:hypothetical protein